MQVRMITTQLGLIKHIPKGTVLKVRPFKNVYQVLTGEFAGKYIDPSKCAQVTSGRHLSAYEWREMEQGYLNVIKNLERDNRFLKEKCATHEKDKEMNEFLLETTVKALMRIAELKQEKEIQNG